MKPVWSTIQSLASNVNVDWVIMGDFNSKLECDDRLNGVSVSNVETHDFRNLLDSTD